MIKLDENFHIDTDSNNFTLKFVKVSLNDKKKEVTSKSVWYCKDLAHALDIYTNESLKECEDIKDVQQKLISVRRLIKSICL